MVSNSPNGSPNVLTTLYQQVHNKWYHRCSLQRLFFTITSAINRNAWLNVVNTKYIEVRIDMRDGAFLIKDSNGDLMTEEQVKNLLNVLVKDFPENEPKITEAIRRKEK